MLRYEPGSIDILLGVACDLSEYPHVVSTISVGKRVFAAETSTRTSRYPNRHRIPV
jgi:hypothetical protein